MPELFSVPGYQPRLFRNLILFGSWLKVLRFSDPWLLAPEHALFCFLGPLHSHLEHSPDSPEPLEKQLKLLSGWYVRTWAPSPAPTAPPTLWQYGEGHLSVDCETLGAWPAAWSRNGQTETASRCELGLQTTAEKQLAF